MSDKANINPQVFLWARTTARLSIETAAAKVSVGPEKITEWEQGISQPTIRQAETLAKLYRRPFALFFLPQVPLDFQPLQDFRRPDARALGTASIFIIREIQQKQAWLRELHQDNDESPAAFVGRFTLQANPADVAADMLQTLGITPGRYTARTPMKEWIEKSEAQGIFISRTSFIHSRLTLDSDELQGFAIADPMAPFVFINSEDWDAPQLFTLVHELAHLWIAATGISNTADVLQVEKGQLHPIELFCNEVAAAALLPASLMRSLRSETFQSYQQVFTAARQLGVSAFAFSYRAYQLTLIGREKYRQFKSAAEEAFRDYLQREEIKSLTRNKSEGGPNYYRLLLSKNGMLFTKVVLDAFRGGYMPPTQASQLLNTPINKFPKLEAFLYT